MRRAGLLDSDVVAALAQAAKDGVDVINFSISGGANPYADAVELGFLDLYTGGTFIAASAGNSGPGAGAVNHSGPWVTTVAASTPGAGLPVHPRSLNGPGGTATLTGSTITTGIASPLPIVNGASPPYSNAGCTLPAPAGGFTGKLVVCTRVASDMVGRVRRGFNMFQAVARPDDPHQRRAVGHRDRQPLPAHRAPRAAEGAALLAFLAANPGATGSFPTGGPATTQGDVITGFSSRGPGTS